MSAKDAIEELQARAIQGDEEEFARAFDKAMDVLRQIADKDPMDDVSVSRLHQLIERELAPDLSPEAKKRKELRGRVAAVLTDVANFPQPARAHLAGHDLNQVIAEVTDAVWGFVADSASSEEPDFSDQPPMVWEYKVDDSEAGKETYLSQPQLVWEEYSRTIATAQRISSVRIYKRLKGSPNWIEVESVQGLFGGGAQ